MDASRNVGVLSKGIIANKGSFAFRAGAQIQGADLLNKGKLINKGNINIKLTDLLWNSGELELENASIIAKTVISQTDVYLGGKNSINSSDFAMFKGNLLAEELEMRTGQLVLDD